MPSIWIADLAAYNAGHLVGEWVELDADTDAEDVYAKIKEICARGDELLRKLNEWSGPHEEFAIHDYEGFGPIKIGEYDPISAVMAHVERMGDDPDKYFAYVKHNGEHYAENYDEDRVVGPLGSSMQDVAYQLVDDLGYLEGVPEHVARYFDYDMFTRDLEIEGNYVEYDGQFYEITD
ncbi:ArdA-like antirestriction protein [Gordonia phage SpeedDemon]|nr:ArdA-like antirestriction protein [Gordonia phage SpeedDemon]